MSFPRTNSLTVHLFVEDLLQKREKEKLLPSTEMAANLQAAPDAGAAALLEQQQQLQMQIDLAEQEITIPPVKATATAITAIRLLFKPIPAEERDEAWFMALDMIWDKLGGRNPRWTLCVNQGHPYPFFRNYAINALALCLPAEENAPIPPVLREVAHSCDTAAEGAAVAPDSFAADLHPPRHTLLRVPCNRHWVGNAARLSAGPRTGGRAHCFP